MEQEKNPFNNIRPDFEYKGKIYNARKTSLKPYRAKAMEYILDYEKFVREKMDKNVEEDYKSFISDNVDGKDVVEDGKVNVTKFLKQLVSKDVKSLKAIDDYTNLTESLLEIWLTTNDKDKELCHIYFDNADDINLDIETEENEEEYFEFIKKVFNAFFLNYKKLGKLLIK